MTMKKLKSVLLLIIMIILPMNFVFAQSSSESSASNDEKAILRDALKQALNKLTDYEAQLMAAKNAINALKKERKLAEQQFEDSEINREQMTATLNKADKAIIDQRALIEELKTQTNIYDNKIKILEKQLKSERFKVKVYKTLSVIGILSGVLIGIFVTNKLK